MKFICFHVFIFFVIGYVFQWQEQDITNQAVATSKACIQVG